MIESKFISSIYLVVFGFVLISPIQKSVNIEVESKDQSFNHFDFSELNKLNDSINCVYDSLVFSNVEQKIKLDKTLKIVKKEVKELKKENSMLKDSLEVLVSDTIIEDKKKRNLIDKILNR